MQAPSTTEKDRQDIDQRLLRLASADPGFFVLAVHSLIEGTIKKAHAARLPGPDQPCDFGNILDIWLQNNSATGLTLHRLKSLMRDFRDEHRLTNRVRHEFGTLTEEMAILCAQRLISLADSASFFGPGDVLPELRKKASAWDDQPWKLVASDEYRLLLRRLKAMSEKNKGFELERQAWQAVEEESQRLKEELSRLSVDAKVRGQELEARLGELENRRKQELEEYRQWMDEMEQVSFLTRTRFEWQRRLTTLSDEQKDILASLRLDRDILLTGGAGTGKSLILMKLMERLQSPDSGYEEQPGLGMQELPTWKHLAYNHSLDSCTHYLLARMGMPVKDEMLGTVDSFLLESVRLNLDPAIRYDFAWKDLADLKAAFGTAQEEDQTLTQGFLVRELEEVLWSRMVSKEEYLGGFERTGMKTGLANSARARVWKFKEEVEALFWTRKSGSLEFWACCLAVHLESSPGARQWDYILLDEAQDLSAARLACLRKLSGRSLIMAADPSQRLYKAVSPFSRAGIQLSGSNARTLRINFRNTRGIARVAEGFRLLRPQGDAVPPSQAFRDGPEPELFVRTRGAELEELMRGRIDMLIQRLHYDPASICIVTVSPESQTRLLKSLLDMKLQTQQLGRDFDFGDRSKIALGTLQGVKGLDFPVILLYLPYPPSVDRLLSEESRDVLIYNQLYVAMSRAMDYLLVFVKDEDTRNGGTREPWRINLEKAFEAPP